MMSSSIASNHVKVLQIIQAHTSDVNSVEFYGNSLLLTASSDKTIRLFRWNAGSGFVEDAHSPFLSHKYGVTKAIFSPKGHVIASASVDGTVILWDITTGQKTDYLFQENAESIRNSLFSPNGNSIVSSDDSGSICIWGQSKTLKKTLKFHEEAVHTLAFSADSNIFLTGCTLGNIRLFLINDFEVESIEPDCSIDCAHDMGVLGADFCKITHNDPVDPNTTTIYTLATAGTDHLIKIWRIFCITNGKPSRRSSICSDQSSGGSYVENFASRLIPTSPQEHVSGISTIYCTKVMNAECVNTLVAHGSSVTCVKFNQSGTFLVSGSLDKTIKIWDLQGNCLKTLAEHHRYVNCVSLNSDSSLLASGSNDRTVIIWDLTNTFTLESHIANGIRSLLFTLASNQVDIPADFICPITHEIMKDPVKLEDGFCYEKSAIEEWFSRGKTTSPMTNIEIPSDMEDNVELKNQIDKYLKALDFDPFE